MLVFAFAVKAKDMGLGLLYLACGKIFNEK